jgi:hypothetical protein
MTKRAIIPLIILLMAFLASCVERIEIPLDSSSVRLVVDGSITTDTMAHRVVLSETSGYYYNKAPEAVRNARVSISDGTSVFQLNESEPGSYLTDPSVYGVPGHTYTLSITLDSPIGGVTQYEAEAKLYPVNTLDSVSLTYQPDWAANGMWEVKCYVQDPPSADFYRFLVSRNGKMLTDTLNEWFVTDDRLFNGNYAYGATVAYLRQDRNDENLIAGDTITLEINSIGEAYTNFIMDAQAEVWGANPLFSGPPANVKGNISNGAIGFFSAYSVSRASTVVKDDF